MVHPINCSHSIGLHLLLLASGYFVISSGAGIVRGSVGGACINDFVFCIVFFLVKGGGGGGRGSDSYTAGSTHPRVRKFYGPSLRTLKCGPGSVITDPRVRNYVP